MNAPKVSLTQAQLDQSKEVHYNSQSGARIIEIDNKFYFYLSGGWLEYASKEEAVKAECSIDPRMGWN